MVNKDEHVVNKDEADGEQQPDFGQGEKDLNEENNQADFMEFSVTELAEQLTKQDSVSSCIYMLSILTQ